MTTSKRYEYNKTWRHNHPEKRHEGKQRYYRKTQNAPNHKRAWSAEDEQLVLNWEGTDTELSAKIGRSVAAIQHKRGRLLGTCSD